MPDAETKLKKIGLKYSERELVSDKPHWEIRPKDCEVNLENFKQLLKNASVFYDDESENNKGKAEQSHTH